MRKYSFILIALCLLIAAGQQTRAQVAIATAKELAFVSRGVARAAKKGNPLYKPGSRTGLYSFQVTHLLKQRVKKARREALAAQQTIPFRYAEQITYHPVTGLLARDPFYVEPLFKNAPFLGKSKDFRAYLSAQENRLYVQEIRRLREEVWPRLHLLLPLLEQETWALEQPADPLKFVVQKIPPSVDTILVGEMHGAAGTKQAVGQLLKQLRQAQPEREIILFTEFLPEYFKWKGKIPEWNHPVLQVPGFILGNFLALWDQANALHIPVIGLEPAIACLNREIMPRFEPTDTIVATSLIGMKYRNEQFTEILQKYRQQHPQALFVVYAGDEHVRYSAPFSLANQLPLERTFILSIHPNLQVVAKNLGISRERLAQRGFDSPISFANSNVFSQRLLYWSNKELAKAAGFDAFIRVEEKP